MSQRLGSRIGAPAGSLALGCLLMGVLIGCGTPYRSSTLPSDGGADAACACDDGNPCNGVEACVAGGGCMPGTPLDCTGLDDACNTGACDPSDGACVATPMADGTPCDDGAFCTDPDFCTAGVCGGDPRDCSMGGDFCNAGGCDEGTDLCTGMPVLDGSPCTDGLFCTTGETCQVGVCTGAAPRDCSGVSDSCNAGACNEGLMMCEQAPFPDGSPCDDLDACTGNDQCTGGLCGGAPVDADGDGASPLACPGGTDCDDDPGMCGAACGPAVSEAGVNCMDGFDNDCDFMTDSADPDCAAACTPGSTWCDVDGRTLRTCDAAGIGPDPALDVLCGFACNAGACLFPSNGHDAAMGGCDAGDPPLAPTSGSVTFDGSTLTCSAGCGAGPSIAALSTGGGVSVFCVSSVSLPAAVALDYAPGTTNALVILVAADATVDGSIDLSGGDGALGPTGYPSGGGAGGAAGPGGSDGGEGAPTGAADGFPGLGAGGGGGGDRTGGCVEAGGGGGGGFGGAGGVGGTGNCSLAGTAGPTYGVTDLSPVAGGSGGGGGGDGGSAMDGAGGGGGGGGAVQIVVRGTLTVSGTIDVRGGDGGDSSSFTCGGGGGGSGGGILLEAMTFATSGTCDARGGAGGDGGGGAGGAGASGGSTGGSLGISTGAGGGGAGGGGGGGGRVRINALSGATCAGANPMGASVCSTGSLRTTP